MNADNFSQMQFQMRQNQQELQDYLRGLDSWEADIKEKDVHLRDSESGNSREKDLPPVRNSLNQKKKKKIKKAKEEKEKDSKPKRINSYDYRAWDKFNVEEECNKVDDNSNTDSSSEYETDDEWEEQRRKQQAIMEKDKGNQFFKEGKYDEAVECYSKGFDLDPMNVLLPANRAMALLKQKKYAAAESDCTVAISLDPTYVKAYSRRATARLALNKQQEAQADFGRVLKLEPSNKQAKSEIEKIDKSLNPKKEEFPAEQPGIVKAIFKPPELRSKKPLRRIEIEEIGVEDNRMKDEIRKIEDSQSIAKQRVTAKDNQSFQHFIQEQTEENTKAGDRCIDTDLKDGELKLNLSADDTEGISKTEKVTHSVDQVSASPITRVPENGGDENSSPSTSPRVPAVPQNSFQFQTDCKELKKHEEKFYSYIKKIDPAAYPRLFGQALDAELLMRMLNAFKNYYLPNKLDVYNELWFLSQVKRFSMAVMFMSPQEKEVIRELFRYVREMEQHSKKDIDKLAVTYEL